MWHLRTKLSADHSGAGVVVGLGDFTGLFQPLQLCDSMIFMVIRHPDFQMCLGLDLFLVVGSTKGIRMGCPDTRQPQFQQGCPPAAP